MVDGKASLYVGSPRMVEMAIGEKTTLEDWAARACTARSPGCGDVLAASDEEAIELAQPLPRLHAAVVPRAPRGEAGAAKPGRSIDEIVPYDQRKWFDMYEVIDRSSTRALVRDQALFAGSHRRLRAPRAAAPSASSPTSPRSRAAC
jgi:acetyl-CoA carboxylase carboxyltransferase component